MRCTDTAVLQWWCHLQLSSVWEADENINTRTSTKSNKWSGGAHSCRAAYHQMVIQVLWRHLLGTSHAPHARIIQPVETKQMSRNTLQAHRHSALNYVWSSQPFSDRVIHSDSAVAGSNYTTVESLFLSSCLWMYTNADVLCASVFSCSL